MPEITEPRSLAEILRDVLDNVSNAGAVADPPTITEDLIEEGYLALEALER